MQTLIESYLAGDNILITGGAGVGKSYWTKQLYNLENDKRVKRLTASTGIAALSIGGQTVHKFSGTGGYTAPQDTSKVCLGKPFRDAVHRIQNTAVLFLDEVSMSRSDFFELLNLVFSRARANSDFFGGMQIVLIGDFLQLPPVYLENEDVSDKYVFETAIFAEGNFKIFNLTDVKRQSDPVFISILNEMRFGRITDETIKLLAVEKHLKNPVWLVGTNREADTINLNELHKIEGEEFIIKSIFMYDSSTKEAHRKLLFKELVNDKRCPLEVKLKLGCRVMVTVNEKDADYVNGSQGVLVDYGYFLSIGLSQKYSLVEEWLQQEHGMERGYKYKVTKEQMDFIKANWETGRRFKNDKSKAEPSFTEYVVVKLDDGSKVFIKRHQQEIKDEMGDYEDQQLKLALCAYFPIQLAYAITVHKSQGMTLDEVYVDASRIGFAEGHVYVACSRARTLQGLQVMNLTKDKVKACSRAVAFYDCLV